MLRSASALCVFSTCSLSNRTSGYHGKARPLTDRHGTAPLQNTELKTRSFCRFRACPPNPPFPRFQSRWAVRVRDEVFHQGWVR